jgi:hypothetical protein
MDTATPDPAQRPRLRLEAGAPAWHLIAPAARLTHAFGSARADGRLSAPIDAKRQWRQRAAIGIAPDPFVELLLGAGQRLVACSDARWNLIDAGNARVIRSGLRVGGAPSLDADGRTLYVPADAGTLEAIELASGALQYILKPRFGEAYRRAYVDARGTSVVIGSVQQPGPHGAAPADLDAVLERLEFDDPPLVGAQQIVKARRTALFDVPPNPLFAGSAGRLACVRKGLLDWFDSPLKLRASFAGDFAPRWLCVPDDEHLLMVVDVPAGPSEVWSVDVHGQAHRLCDLKGQRALQPPVVASETRVYVITESAVLAINPGKGIAWGHACEDVRGGLATSTNQLLVVAGNSVQLVDVEHKTDTLFACDQRIRSNAAPLASGEIAVATEGQVHLFEPAAAGIG